MYAAQAAIKPNTLLRNGAYGIVIRGVQKCTCAGAALRSRKRLPLCCIKISDIISRFKNLEAENNRKRTDKSFMVSKKEIADNDYDLSINKYKEVEYVAVEYPPTSEIMANIREIQKQISQEMDELEKLLILEEMLLCSDMMTESMLDFCLNN